MTGDTSQPITPTDLAAIGDAIGRGPGLTSARPSIAPLLATAGIDTLAADAAPAEIEAALTRLRESIDPATDDLTRATIRESIRASHPTIPARMIDAALAPPPPAPRDDDRPRRSQATRLVDLVVAAGAELWHSPAGDPHVTLPAEGHREHHRLATRPVRDWLARRYHATAGAAPGSQAIADALSVLGGMARYDGAMHDVHVRVAGHRDRAYLDLGGPDWGVIEIDAEGWRIVSDPPVRLIRPRGLLALHAPTRGGSIDALRELLHVGSDDDYRVIVGWLLGALRPTGPYPLLALVGEHGAGKSSAARVVQRIIDRHSADLRAEPRDIDALMIAAIRSRVVAIDNVSHLPPWLSDALCRVATGGSLSRRELYTDADEVIIEAQRPVMLTSIGDVVTRGDLLDRAIVVTLPVLREPEGMTEDELWRRHEQIAPAMLGALLDGVSSALARERQTQIDRLPRMADWARWTTAAEPGIGWPEQSILTAYRAMRQMIVETALEGDPLAAAIRRITLPWRGTATELLDRLTPAGRPPRGWPESARLLSIALRRLAPGLRRVGVEVTYDREPRRRLITLDAATAIPPAGPSSSSSSSSRPCLLAGSDDATPARPSPEALLASSGGADRPDGDDATSPASPGASSDRRPDYGRCDDGDDGDDVSGLSLGGVPDGY